MELWLVDVDAELVRDWQREFAGLPEVRVRHGDILEVAEDTLVSPANSLGVMDGGIDLAYLKRFGIGMQEAVFRAIAEYHDGVLPVGAAVVVKTGDTRIPRIVCAPTMVRPEPVPRSHAFFAMSAALAASHSYRPRIRKLFIPGLATGIGCVPPREAAAEMAAAYRKWIAGRGVSGEIF